MLKSNLLVTNEVDVEKELPFPLRKAALYGEETSVERFGARAANGREQISLIAWSEGADLRWLVDGEDAGHGGCAPDQPAALFLIQIKSMLGWSTKVGSQRHLGR